MVVGEGLFGASRLTLRAALTRVVSRCSTRTLVEGSHPSPPKNRVIEIILGKSGEYLRWWWEKDSNLRSL